MRTLRTMMFAVLLLLAPAYAFSSNLGHLRLSLVEGDVQVMTPEAGEWGIASVNTPLDEGDQVWVPAGSRAELQLDNGTYVRLDQNSSLQILAVDTDSSQFYLSQGRCYVHYNGPIGSVLQLDTPDASSRSFKRASFRADVADYYTDFSVYRGYLEAENSAGKTSITAGQMASLGEDSDGEVAPLGFADEWEDWNKMRDRRIFATRHEAARYLPAELRAYSADLDNSGRWVMVPEYGYLWTPTVGIDVNWSPYREGRWIWRGGEYVWIGAESWGWVPYHYGRWVYAGGIGWCWAPPAERDVYWGPGYVGWVRTPEYVAWVPLAPGEVYYGRGNYGRNSVNIVNVNVTRVNVTTVYKNVNVSKAVTVVNRDSFSTPTPVRANVNNNVIQKNLFVKANITIGTPDIKPTRASSLTSVKSVPQEKRPPALVRELRVQDLKHARPFVKDHDKSVIAPGTKPVDLPVRVVNTPGRPGKGAPSLQPLTPVQGGKPAAAGAPLPRGERRLVRPIATGRAGAPGQPASRAAAPSIPAAENRKGAAAGSLPPTAAEPAAQRSRAAAPSPPATENGNGAATGSLPPTAADPATQAPRRGRSRAPAVAVPQRGEQAPESLPAEKRKHPATDTPASRFEQQNGEPVEKGEPATAAPGSRAERGQAPAVDKRKTAAPGVPAQKAARPKPPKKHKAADDQGEPDAKDKKGSNKVDH